MDAIDIITIYVNKDKHVFVFINPELNEGFTFACGDKYKIVRDKTISDIERIAGKFLDYLVELDSQYFKGDVKNENA